MSFFGATIENIESIKAHPNADKLELAKLVGMEFQCVVGKGSFYPRDLVVYIPEDALLPEWLMLSLGLFGKLSGPQKNRVKTIRLRGEYSQGIVAPIAILEDKTNPKYHTDYDYLFDESDTNEDLNRDVTEYLGITKYEPAEILCKDAKLDQLPVGLSKYDIEGADRNSRALEELRGQTVWVTEKLEGSNFSVTVEGAPNGKVFVNQRNHTVLPLYEGLDHTWWKVAERDGWIDTTSFIAKRLYMESNAFISAITIYGEMVGPGIQGNIYQLKDHRVYAFDMCMNTTGGKVWVPFGQFKETIEVITGYCDEKNIDYTHPPTCVPVIKVIQNFQMTAEEVKAMSNGKSLLHDGILREGIVLRPDVEFNSEQLRGRMILKQRSPEYLANSK